MESGHNDILEYLLRSGRIDAAQIHNPDNVNDDVDIMTAKVFILLHYSLGIPSLTLPKYGTLLLFHCSITTR